jgi:glucose/arabinose dehydrogenase
VALAGTWAPRAHAQGTVPTGFEDRLIVGALDFPIGLAFLPDGRAFVIEQKTARIRLIVNGALAATDPVATLPGVQTAGPEQGLLGIAVDPRWPASAYIYVHCDNLGTSTIRISRYLVTGDLGFTGNGALTIDPASRYDLINDLPDVASNHNGGTLRFGPDGKLYDSMGEDAQRCVAQDDSTLHGVILRLDVTRLPAGSGGPAARALITPADNPQVSATNLQRRLIWAFGLRNPFRFHIDPTDGSLFIGDVGENLYEEIDHATSAPLDFGWPNREGPVSNEPTCIPPITLTAPIFYYDRTGFPSGAAVVSAGIYRTPSGGANVFPPDYEGDYFFSDYYNGFLRRIRNSGGTWSLAPAAAGQPGAFDWGQGFDSVSDYLEASDGALWYVRQSIGFAGGTGEVRRIAPLAGAGGPAATVTFAVPYPSPAIGSAGLYYTLAVSTRVELTIYDLRGRQVKRIVPGEDQGPGSHFYSWDGTDEDGRAMPAGMYFARLLASGAHLERRIPFIR